MLPLGHAVAGYLAYWAVVRVAGRRWPTPGEAATVLLATQLPDLIDKPLAWGLGVLPTGRSLGHSLLTATALLALVVLVARRVDRPTLAAAFGLGYVVHLLTDLPSSVLAGDLYWATYLLWPVLPSPDYTEPAIAADLAAIEPTPTIVFQAVAGLCFVVLLVATHRFSTPG